MTDYNVQNAKHATLGAATADNVIMSGCRAGVIRVYNRATSGAPLYFRVYASNHATKPAFTAAADDTIAVPFGQWVDFAWAAPQAYVKVISADAQAYSVQSMNGI